MPVSADACKANRLTGPQIAATKRAAYELTGYKPGPANLLWHVWFRSRADKARTRNGRCTARNYSWWAKKLGCKVRTIERYVAFLKRGDPELEISPCLLVECHFFAGKKTPYIHITVDAQRAIGAAANPLNVQEDNGIPGGIPGGITTNRERTANEQPPTASKPAKPRAHTHEAKQPSPKTAGLETSLGPGLSLLLAKVPGRDKNKANATNCKEASPEKKENTMASFAELKAENKTMAPKKIEQKEEPTPTSQLIRLEKGIYEFPGIMHPSKRWPDDWPHKSREKKLEAQEEHERIVWRKIRPDVQLDVWLVSLMKLKADIEAEHDAKAAAEFQVAYEAKQAEIAAKQTALEQLREHRTEMMQQIQALSLDDLKGMLSSDPECLPCPPWIAFGEEWPDLGDVVKANYEAKWVLKCKERLTHDLRLFLMGAMA